MLLNVAIAAPLSVQAANISSCSEMEFILWYLARPSLFTKWYSKHFKLISKVKNSIVSEGISKSFVSFLSLGQKYNFGCDMEALF